jgi:hypothetical protein
LYQKRHRKGILFPPKLDNLLYKTKGKHLALPHLGHNVRLLLVVLCFFFAFAESQTPSDAARLPPLLCRPVCASSRAAKVIVAKKVKTEVECGKTG